MNALTPDRARIDTILARARSARIARGLLILGLETIDRAANVKPWMLDLGYQTQVIVGDPHPIVSPWFKHADQIKQIKAWGKQHRDTGGLTSIVSMVQHAIESAKTYPDDRITLGVLGDCINDSEEEIYSYAPELKRRGIQVVMMQDAPCDTGQIVYQEFARLTDGTFIQPFTMNNPPELEKVLRTLTAEKPKTLG